MPDLANIHIDVALTNLSVAYTNEDYVAPRVFPVVPVDKRSDRYFLYNKDAFLRSSGTDRQGRPGSIRRPGSRSTEILFDVSTNPYYCEQLARNYALTDAETRIADAPLQPGIDATLALTEMILLDNEVAVAGKVMKRANYAASNKAQLTTGTTSWAQNAQTAGAYTSFPLSVDIPKAKKAVIGSLVRSATNILLNYNAAVTLSQNWEYLDKIKYVSREGLTASGLAPVIGGLTVVEARTQRANSAEGATPVTTGFVWTDDQSQDAALVYYAPTMAPSLRMVVFGLTFDAPDDTLNARGFLVKRWREEWIDAERIEVRTTRDWRFVATDGSTNGDNASGYATGGYLISGCTL
jgi:hypothetical protein